MNDTPRSDEQKALWNGPAGKAWVEEQELLDRLLKPYEDLLVDAMSECHAQRVLDIGCGTGSTTLAVARRLGAPGRVVGVDISEPMIELARARAAREASSAEFVCADAQTQDVAPGNFDTFISRFGVMFFDDPVRAFGKLRAAAARDAQTRLIAWRSAAENPFMTTAERAAAPLLPNLPPRRANAPGQFAFADRDRVHRILAESGWSDIDIRPLDVSCNLSTGDLDHYLARLGPVGMFLQDADEATRTAVNATVRAAFEPFVHGSQVEFTAACWMIMARS